MSVDVQERRRLTAALLGEEAAPPPDDIASRVVRGVILDVNAHMLRVATPNGEERFLFERSTAFWRGGDVEVGELRVGDDVVIRCAHGGQWVAERVWAQLARVTGVITDSSEDTLEIDTGHGHQRRTAVIPYRASGRMAVRHPRLQPGYLFDAIGTWQDGVVRALLPATTQPPYQVADTPPPPPVRHGSPTVSGSVSWYDPALGRSPHLNPLARLTGAAYPALDRGGDCGTECDRADSCAPLPLLSLGTTFRLRNDCTGETAVLPVIACGAASSRFCDRCTACDTDAHGRIAALTLTTFVAMGGHPETGCFNATLTVGGSGARDAA